MIVAIVTAYKPDDEFVNRFLPLLTICESVIVVDNTPGGCRNFDLPPRFVLIQNMKNLGLGKALNIGIREAKLRGAVTAILFDQDSSPTAALISDLESALKLCVSANGPRCCVGPLHLDDGNVTARAAPRSEFISSRSAPGLASVACLPTSGMIFDLTDLDDEDCFSTELFLDLVDFEWCWRLGTKGWTFWRAMEIEMYHRLGESQRSLMGLVYHVPAPYRHYFQVRDTLRLASKDYVPAYAKFRLMAVLPVKALVFPLILDHGVERLGWMIRGLVDYFKRIDGVGSARKRLSN